MNEISENMIEDVQDVFFKKEETEMLTNLSSFNFVKVHTTSKSIVKEKCLLYKARRVYENELVRLLKTSKEEHNKQEEQKIKETLNDIYLKLGHVHLLAHDFARAFSAYQKALNGTKEYFWREPSGLFGLGLVYFHFRSYKACIEAFNKLLYSHPFIEVVHEVHVRLGLAHKSLENYSQALKHLQIALDDLKESSLLPKQQLRFHIAHCYDSSGDLRRATDEYKKLLSDQAVQGNPSLNASILRQLGWICYRTECLNAEQRALKVKEAESLLLRSKEIEPNHGRTFYYLGRCYSELPDRAHDAFTHYRQAIDKSEGDADTWCSIGVLYHHQQQDTDALQAFVCAIQLDPEHSASWTDLGRLYEAHNQFQEALYCYKKAVKYKPTAPEALKARIQVLERELSSNGAHLLANGNSGATSGHRQVEKLDSLDKAWTRGIPAELGPRQRELVKHQQYKYREGSPLWGMSELAAYSLQKPFSELNDTQRQIMEILKLNEKILENNELDLLNQLEARYPMTTVVPGPSCANVNALAMQGRPKEDLPFASVTQDDLEDVLGDTSAILKNETLDSELHPADGKTPADFDALAQASEGTSEQKQENKEEIQEEKISSTSGELPPTFSLLSKVHVPITVTSSEIFEMVKKRHEKPEEYRPIFEEMVEPPKAPEIPKVRPPKEKLVLPTPLIQVESVRDAHAPELQKFCYEAPIALIRGLTSALKIDLSLFSTKSLIETAPDHPVEIRTQYKMPGDANVDHLGNVTWNCYSMPSHSTISRYGNYQAESFRYSLKEETEKLRQAASTSKYTPQTASTSYAHQNGSMDPPSAKKRRTGGQDDNVGHMPMKVIKFGTNVDLSDEALFRSQLRELDKMPAFCRIVAGCNLLTHLGHTVLGMNSVQLYMKIPGCRTPGHLENNRFASININIGPGECEWFGVPHEYWPAIEKMCRERNLDFLKGSWWPNFEDLIKEGVPVYRFTQKAGDLVWVGGGCVHWVQSIGWCNNIAWNVGPMTADQMEMALEAHEWNKLNMYRSLVPMQHLCWQLASNVRFCNQRMFNVIKNVLIRSLAYQKMLVNFVHSTMKGQIKSQPRLKGEAAHYCDECEVEVFNILFVKEINGKFHVFCVQCARRSNLEDYVPLQQVTFEELASIFDQFQLQPAKSALVC